jgi:hypothetical protein
MRSRLPTLFRTALLAVALAWLAAAGGGAPGLAATPVAGPPAQLADVPPARVLFALPRIGADGNVETRRDAEGAATRLVFDEIAAASDPDAAPVRAYLERTPAFDLVRRLYTYSWRRGAGGGANGGWTGEAVLVLVVTDLFGDLGPSHIAEPLVVARAGGEDVRAGSFLLLSNLRQPVAGTSGPDLTLDALIRHDYLGLALAHETAHQMMSDRYGRRDQPRDHSLVRSGHDTDRVTDPPLAFSEGWAEAFEAIVGDMLVAGGTPPVVEEPSIALMARRRREMVEGDPYLPYVFEDLDRRTGRLKSGFRQVSTEGVVAYLVFQSYQNRIVAGPRRRLLAAQPEAFGRILDTLARHRPRHVVEFWRAVEADASEPALKEKLRRIFVEWTKYATVDPTAPARYRAWWEADRAATRLPPSHPGRAIAAEEQRAQDASYRAFRVELFRRSLSAAPAPDAPGALDAALPPLLDPLWVDHGIRRIALNLASADELAEFLGAVLGAVPDRLRRAQAAVEARDSAHAGGYFRDVRSLAEFLTSAEMGALEAARRAFEDDRRAATAAGPGAGAGAPSAYIRLPVRGSRGRHLPHGLVARLVRDMAAGSPGPAPKAPASPSGSPGRAGR